MVGTHGGSTWWEHMVGAHGGNTWWEHMVGTHGGSSWWEHMVGTHGGNTWWEHISWIFRNLTYLSTEYWVLSARNFQSQWHVVAVAESELPHLHETLNFVFGNNRTECEPSQFCILCVFWKCMSTVDWNNRALFFGSPPRSPLPLK